jgi:ribosomal protein S27E
MNLVFMPSSLPSAAGPARKWVGGAGWIVDLLYTVHCPDPQFQNRLNPVFPRQPRRLRLPSRHIPNHTKQPGDMDINFKCTHCGQDLTVDGAGAGMQIECPACNRTIQVPQTAESKVINPIMTSASAREEHHFKVPQHDKSKDVVIEKAKPTLEAAAKETDKKLRVKTIRRSDCVEVGKDHFDEVVTGFFDKVGEANITNITPITYTHQDLATRQWVTDFGVLIVYRG